MGLFLNFRYKYNETYHKWSSLRDFTAKLELKNNWHGNNSKFCIQRSIQISLKFTFKKSHLKCWNCAIIGKINIYKGNILKHKYYR